MPSNVSEMVELTRYNNLIANAMKEKWAEAGVGNEMVRRTHEAIDEAIKDLEVPEFVSLRRLLEAFVEEHAEEAMQRGWEAPRIEIKESEDADGYWHIYFDEDPGESRYGHRRSVYELNNMLAATSRSQPDNDDPHPTGEVYAAKVGGNLMGRRMGVWSSAWEKLMVALYYGGARLVIDCDGDDIAYPH